jgi:hypothetical protein
MIARRGDGIQTGPGACVARELADSTCAAAWRRRERRGNLDAGRQRAQKIPRDAGDGALREFSNELSLGDIALRESSNELSSGAIALREFPNGLSLGDLDRDVGVDRRVTIFEVGL